MNVELSKSSRFKVIQTGTRITGIETGPRSEH